MEILEIVHEQTGEPTGIALPRAEALAQQAWCRSTNVYVLNHEGQVLCHQRSLKKERMPGFWMTHLGGHVGHQETYETNALKELEEEAGIVADPLHLIAWRTTRIDSSRLWTREFVTLQNVSPENLVPQPGEVDQFAWKSPEEILKEAKEQKNWCAGTHGFYTEYHCLRAALSAAQAHGLIPAQGQSHIWQHVKQV